MPTDDPMDGLGTVERAMVQRAAFSAEVVGLAEDAGCTPVQAATTVVRAIMMTPRWEIRRAD